MIKIAFSGKAGSGKSTAVHYLIQKYGGKEVKFASPLYDAMFAVQDALNLPKEKDGLLLQVLGTEWGRKLDEDFWVNQFIKKLPDGNVYCSDVRFPNEVKSLIKQGFLVIRLERKYEHRKQFILNRDTKHPSEIALDDYEFENVVYNNDNIEDFQNQIEELICKKLNHT